MGCINQIILSANEDPLYIDFWRPVAWAYKKMFPDVTVHLAFLTNRDENDEYVTELRTHGKVTLIRPVDFVPEFTQAKMARFILAAQQGNDVCYIDDIDLLPLRKDFITNKTDKRPDGYLLCVGGEVYHNNGCYPVSQMTAEGNVWKRFINPFNKTLDELYREWCDTPFMFDRRENPLIPLDFSQDSYFSDERLLRRLTTLFQVPKYEMERGYNDFLSATIDRHTWVGNRECWEYDSGKLEEGGFVNAHCIRPFKKYEGHFGPLFNYINKNY